MVAWLPSVAASAGAASAGAGLSLSGLGSIASGIGSIAGAFGLGRSKQKSLGQQLKTNLNWKKQEALDLPIHIRRGAEAAGLHPLTVMGMNHGGGNVVMNEPANALDLGQMGQGIDRALNAGRTKVQRQLDELALEKAQLSNDFLRTQIAGAQKSIASHAETPSLPHQSDGNIVSGSKSDRVSRVSSDAISHVKGDRSTEAAASPMWKRFYIDNDRYINLPPNQSIEELGYAMGTVKGVELMGKTYMPKRGFLRPYAKRSFNYYKNKWKKLKKRFR